MALFDTIRAGSSTATDFEIERSLRFNESDTYLSRTPSSDGNRRTWTISIWFKNGSEGLQGQRFWSTSTAPTEGNYSSFAYENDGFIAELNNHLDLRTSTRYRDSNAWSHVVLAVDTTQSTASDRAKLYFNGVQVTAFDTESYPSQDHEGGWNSTNEHNIGRELYNTRRYFAGYMAEFTNIDGLQLTPSSFAKTDPVTGQYVPIDTSGLTFGTNGFRLKFDDNSNTTATTLGKDSSGNGNNFTPYNFVTGDAVKDTPTNNFPTVNDLYPDSSKGGTVNTGNLRVENANHNLQRINFHFGIRGIATGKYYWEVRNQNGSFAQYVGLTENLREDNGEIMNQTDKNFIGSHTSKVFSAGSGTGRTNQGSNKTMQFLLDVDNQELIAKYDGTTIFTDTGIPSPTSGQYVPYVASTNDGTGGSLWADVIFNFGQDSTFGGVLSAGGNTDENGIGDFHYSVPSGYLALCSKNMPDPTVFDGRKYFGTLLYSAGTSNGTFNFTDSTAVNFTPDWQWIKCRDAGERHRVIDVIRGNQDVTDKFLLPDGEDNETSSGVDGTTVSTIQNGIKIVETSIGSGEIFFTNRNYVVWNWNAGDSTVTNTDGNISAQVRASQTAGFSIVSYTGTGNDNDSVGHGLGVTPDMVVIKTRNAVDSWVVETPHTSNGRGMYWDFDNGSDTAGTDTTSRNSSTVTFVNSGDSNRHVNFSGENYIMYVFASVKGYSSISSYIANGNSDGRFIHTGFNPQFLITKRTSSSGSWEIHDNKRPAYNPHSNRLLIDTTNSEATSNHVDFVSNGFKIRNTFSGMNGSSGDHYLYMAFGEFPFKYGRGR